MSLSAAAGAAVAPPPLPSPPTIAPVVDEDTDEDDNFSRDMEGYEDWTKQRPYIISCVSGERIYIRCEGCLSRDEYIRKKLPFPASFEQENRDLIDSPIATCCVLLDWYMKTHNVQGYRKMCTHIVYNALEEYKLQTLHKKYISFPYGRKNLDVTLISKILEADIAAVNCCSCCCSHHTQ